MPFRKLGDISFVATTEINPVMCFLLGNFVVVPYAINSSDYMQKTFLRQTNELELAFHLKLVPNSEICLAINVFVICLLA